MSHLNNLNNFNVNIDDYSIEELIELLEFDEEPSSETIIKKIDYLNENHFKENNNLRQFFYNVQNKLLNYFENSRTNYLTDNILPNNNLIETMANLEDVNNEDILNLNEDVINLNEDELNLNEDKLNLNEDAINLNEDIVNIKINNDVIENYEVYNYLHFNTLFRSKNNQLLETQAPSTNSNFILATPINNITQIKLASINIKKPYLICEAKLNNKFIIKKYKKSNDSTFICDLSQVIIIEDGYYSEPKEIVDYLNNNYFYKSEYHNNFLEYIIFSININSKKIKFDLSFNYSNEEEFSYFQLDFNTNYTPYYSLANILGFDNYVNTSNSYKFKSIGGTNKTILSPFTYSNKGNSELFFCFDEYQSNIVETHKLFLNNNMSTKQILAKIDTSSANKENNYYINITYSTDNNRNDNIRKYDGLINLLNFNIKIIDYYGNIINTNINENFTFTFEAKIIQTRLIKVN